MRRAVVWSLAILGVLAGVACGRSDADKAREQAEQLRKGAEQMSKGADEVAKSASEAAKETTEGAKEMAQGLENFAKGLGQMAGEGKAPVEPVSFRTLGELFPELAGWEKGKITGEKLSAPVTYSQAKVNYRQGEASIEASITDSGFNRLLLAPYAMFLGAGFERETESGYEKSVKVAGYPGWEKWEQDGDGELNAVVAERFLLQLQGRHLPDTKVLHQLASSTALDRLAGMK